MDRRCLRTSASRWPPRRRAFFWGLPAWAKASCSNSFIGLLRPLEGSVELIRRGHLPHARGKTLSLARTRRHGFSGGRSLRFADGPRQCRLPVDPGSACPTRKSTRACTMRCASWASRRPSISFLSSLSGGMRRRVAIARALINQPRADPLRLAHGRPRSRHLDHHHRTHREAARCARNSIAAGDAPASGRLHALHPPYSMRTGTHGPASRGADQPQHHLPHARRGTSDLRRLSPRADRIRQTRSSASSWSSSLSCWLLAGPCCLATI